MGGGVLLVRYHTLVNLLVAVYPEFSWDSQKFSQQNGDIWTNPSIANSLVQWLKKQPKNEIIYIFRAVKREHAEGFTPLTSALNAAFLQHRWIEGASKMTRKSRLVLRDCIEKLFINKEKDFVLLEDYKHPDIETLELDLFLPQYNIAFEYQVMKEIYL